MTQERTPEQLERIRDFVAALRSGKYRQLQGLLASVDSKGIKSYCCEGVAFERYGEQLGYELRWSSLSGNMTACWTGANGGKYENISVAPAQFWQDMGMLIPGFNNLRFKLPENMECRDTGQKMPQYAELNDDGFTFEQIADLIEWQFLRDGGGESDERVDD
jgi:hypothetical protein